MENSFKKLSEANIELEKRNEQEIGRLKLRCDEKIRYRNIELVDIIDLFARRRYKKAMKKVHKCPMLMEELSLLLL